MPDMNAETFIPHLHSIFTVPLQDGSSYALELVEVSSQGKAAQPEFRDPFSLLFANPRTDAYLPQRTYPLQHPALGSLELFLVPLGPKGGQMLYQCIFG